MKKLNIIYLMGAGRSGTTIIASILGVNKNILTIGEMHQYLEHIIEDKKCSCGQTLNECNVWNDISKDYLKTNKEELIKNNNSLEKVESHKNIIKSIFKRDYKYLEFQEELFSKIDTKHNSKYYLDSAKFISRALQLKKSEKFNVKIIYVVRDVRGVINSFSKQVQTNKSPISTIIYYSLINTLGQIVKWKFSKDIIKVRYEDFIEKPIDIIDKIALFLNEDLNDVKEVINKEKYIDMPHIIGGNRLKTESKIKLKKDLAWKKNISRFKQVLYYFLTLPLMLVNKYKI